MFQCEYMRIYIVSAHLNTKYVKLIIKITPKLCINNIPTKKIPILNQYHVKIIHTCRLNLHSFKPQNTLRNFKNSVFTLTHNTILIQVINILIIKPFFYKCIPTYLKIKQFLYCFLSNHRFIQGWKMIKLLEFIPT